MRKGEQKKRWAACPSEFLWQICRKKNKINKNRANAFNTTYRSWLIGAEDIFTVSGLHCDPGIFRENDL